MTYWLALVDDGQLSVDGPFSTKRQAAKRYRAIVRALPEMTNAPDFYLLTQAPKRKSMEVEHLSSDWDEAREFLETACGKDCASCLQQDCMFREVPSVSIG